MRPLMVLVAVLLLGVACSKAETPRRAATKAPSLHDDFADITPVADGGAYVSVGVGRPTVWYVRGAEGTAVKGLPESISSFGDIVPLANGGALLHASQGDGRGMWYLQGETARRVEEVPELIGRIPNVPLPAWAWAQFQREAKLRRATENQLDVERGDW